MTTPAQHRDFRTTRRVVPMARLITAVSVAVATSFTLAPANVEASDIPTSQNEVEITLPTFSGDNRSSSTSFRSIPPARV